MEYRLAQYSFECEQDMLWFEEMFDVILILLFIYKTGLKGTTKSYLHMLILMFSFLLDKPSPFLVFRVDVVTLNLWEQISALDWIDENMYTQRKERKQS